MHLTQLQPIGIKELKHSLGPASPFANQSLGSLELTTRFQDV